MQTDHSVQALPDLPLVAMGYGDYDERGADLSLLRWMRSLSPLDRLRVMDEAARDAELLLEYGRRHREAKTGQDR